MAEGLRFLAAGQDGLLVECEDLATTLILHNRLQQQPLDGVRELVVGARTLLLSFDARVAVWAELAEKISRIDLSANATSLGEMVNIPVAYDGEDLADVAQHLGWTVDELIRRHTAATYTVAFTGFAPGFAYMTCDDPAFDVPRRTTPRPRIPAGSVAIGGKFGGVYPSDSPGGWQLLGRTPLKMWDSRRAPAAVLGPGNRVRFHDMGAWVAMPDVAVPPFVSQPDASLGLTVTRADRPALFQDLGRPGQAAQGISASGALDRHSLREANLCVGNDTGAAAVEIAYGGWSARAGRPVTLALAGAPAPMTIRTAEGRKIRAPHGRPFALDAGDELTLDTPAQGTRSYLAMRGGFAVEKVLGSAAADTLARVGPPAIMEGDVLIAAENPHSAVDPVRPHPPPLPDARATVTLDVVLGPREDWFTEASLTLLLEQNWEVTSETNRVGARLRGGTPLSRMQPGELPSEGTPRGAIQVPHSGQPVLFLADHPVTGGYPVIAVLARHHFDLAGQVPIGGKIRFRAISASPVRNTPV
jgi:KipI family sensor histidine kinase inhibitor